MKFTVLDSVKLGFDTHLIEDACRGVNLHSSDVAAAISEMKQAGVKVIRSADL